MKIFGYKLTTTGFEKLKEFKIIYKRDLRELLIIYLSFTRNSKWEEV